MPLYRYQAADSKGSQIEGLEEAVNINELKEKLYQQHLYLFKASEATLRVAGVKILSFNQGRVFKLKNNDLISFCEQLKILLNAGIALNEALGIVEQQVQSREMRGLYRQIRQDIIDGKTLSEAFSSPKIIAPAFFIGMLKAGESAGLIEEILDKVAGYLRKQSEFKVKIMMTMIYPAVMLSISVLITIGLLIFIFPKFISIYDRYHAKLPALTQLVVNLSNFVQHSWFIILLLGLLVWGTHEYLQKKSLKWRYRFDSLLLSIPIAGKLLKYTMLSRFSHTLGLLIGGGVPFLYALSTLEEMEDNQIIKEVITKVRKAVEKGESLVTPIMQSGIFASIAVQMIKVGENSGSLNQMLIKVANYYDNEIDQISKKIAALAEPILICIIGLVVGTLVIAMYLPVFGIMKAVQGG